MPRKAAANSPSCPGSRSAAAGAANGSDEEFTSAAGTQSGATRGLLRKHSMTGPDRRHRP
jgi:hypothetical protein